MAKTFYSLGYNLANSSDLSLQNIKVNGHEYVSEDIDNEIFNLTSWWTPSLNTEISARFRIQLNEIKSDCALSKNDQLFLTLFSYCPGTKLQHESKPIRLDTDEVEMEISIPPTEIAENLNLNATITVNIDDQIERRVGSPYISNSRLLNKTWKFLLSGSRTQANVVLLDFSDDSRRAKALWEIKINDNLDFDTWLSSQHSNVLRIEVNKLYEDYIQQPQFQIPMMTDLVMRALDEAINDEEKITFLQNDFVAEGSWAKFVKSMYLNVFTSNNIAVKQKWRDEQDSLRAVVQNLMSSNLEMK